MRLCVGPHEGACIPGTRASGTPARADDGGREWLARGLQLGAVALPAGWCFLLLGLATVLLGVSRTALAFGAASALFGFGHGLMYPAVAAHSVEIVPGNRVRALTLWSGGFMIGVSLGVLLAGMVAERSAIATAVQWAALLPLLATLALRARFAAVAAPKA